jgi:hypothetical protein
MPIPVSADDLVLTELEARQLLRVSKITLIRMRKLADKGGLPFVKLSPGRIGYLRRDIISYLATRRVGTLPGEQPAQAPRQGGS